MEHIHGGDVYSYPGREDFSANINYRGMPESVQRAALAAISESVHYPDPQYRTLRQALAERDRIDPDNLIVGNGAAELMFALTLAKRPAHAYLAVPSFFEYEQALMAADCRVTRYELKKEEDFRIAEAFPDEAEAFFDQSAREGCPCDLLILGNPNNPTGQLISRPILEKLFTVCQSHRVFLVLDESFFDFLSAEDRKKTVSGISFSSAKVFVLRSFTKMYAMPGLRFGYGYCPDDWLIRQMHRLLQPWNVSLPAARSAEAAVKEIEFARETAENIAALRQEMRQTLQEMGLTVYPSCTNYLLLEGPPELADLMCREGYLIRDCSNFPGLSRGFFRICIRSRAENQGIAAAFERVLKGKHI